MPDVFRPSQVARVSATGSATALTIPRGFANMIISNPSTTDDIQITPPSAATTLAGSTFQSGWLVQRGTVQAFDIGGLGGDYSIITTGGAVTVGIMLGVGG